MYNPTKILTSITKIKLNEIIAIFTLAISLLIAPAYCNASQLDSNLLAAANQSQTTYPTDDSHVEGLLYSNSDRVESLNSVDDLVSPQRQKELLDPTQIPAKKQPILDRSDPDNKLLEKTKQMFKDANDF